MPNQYLRIFQQPRSAILLILGFASGLPLALTSGTLQAWMTVENIDLKTIGFFSLVGQAYVFKFLWSPVMDRYTPPFLGRRRGWLITTQILLLLAIAAMGFLEPGTQLRWMAALAVIIAFCSASQDIVFDAWKTDVLPAEERGTGAAISVLGYRLGMLVSGGLALWLADRWLGWQGMYWLMAALLVPCIIATLLAPEPEDSIPVPKTLEQAVAAPLRDFFGRNNAWLILLLIVLYKLGDAFAMSLTTTFLIRGVGFDAGEVGVVNKTLGLLATIVGALYGGIPDAAPFPFPRAADFRHSARRFQRRLLAAFRDGQTYVQHGRSGLLREPVRRDGNGGLCRIVNDAVQQIVFRHPVCPALRALCGGTRVCRPRCRMVCRSAWLAHVLSLLRRSGRAWPSASAGLSSNP
ncbi:muropeptide transporter [Citrobacter koseri]|uniref:Muropeptide transporter n=1 Tax=Citrobacter koseri TaxID=545 RepID=A0A3S4MAE0_CITKO|nr:muropeptide transporter [Citrobacter koseri]